MTVFRRLLAISSVVMTLAGWGSAQTSSAASQFPLEKTIESWLLSGNPRLVAWGAHDTRMAHDRYLAPDLLSLASRWQPLAPQAIDDSNHTELSQQQMDERDAMAAVLDALIQMKVPVPADTLRNLAPDFGNDVAVLLSRMPPEEAESVSFDFYRSPPEHGRGIQYVSAALLALHPVPGFAADLLANLSVHATIFVVAPDTGAIGSGHCDGACGPSSDLSREGWPLIGQYALSKQKTDGAFLLVAGVDPIYATRRESAHYLGEGCGMGVYLGSGERLRLIAEMLGLTPEEIPWQTEVSKSVEFQSVEQFNHAVLDFVEEQQQKYRATVTAMAAHGLLTSSEAEQSLPKLELELTDMRGEVATPMPDPPDLPSRVELSSAASF
jgi:hypothetical protein